MVPHEDEGNMSWNGTHLLDHIVIITQQTTVWIGHHSWCRGFEKISECPNIWNSANWLAHCMEHVQLEKAIVTQIIKKFYAFHGTWRLLLCSQETAPVLSQNNPVHFLILCLFRIHFSIILPSTPRSSPFTSLQPKLCMHFWTLIYATSQVHLIFLGLISPPPQQNGEE